MSETRFLDRLGELTPGQLDDIANAIAICVGAPLRNHSCPLTLTVAHFARLAGFGPGVVVVDPASV